MRSVLLLVGLLLLDAALLVLWMAGTLPENCEQAGGARCSEVAESLAPYSVYAFFAALAITAVAFLVVIARAGLWLARRAREDDPANSPHVSQWQ